MKARPWAVVFEKIGLETVHHFENNLDPCRLGMASRLGDGRDAAVPSLFGRHPGVFRVGGIKDAAELAPAYVAHGAHGVGQHAFARSHRLRIFARHVVADRKAHGDSNIEFQRRSPLGECIEIEFLRAQIGELDEVVTAGGGFLHCFLKHRLGLSACPHERMNT